MSTVLHSPVSQTPTTRRAFLGQSLLAAGGLMVAPRIRAQSKTAPAHHGSIIGHGAHRYRVDHQWSRADPAKTPVNNCHEMVMTADKRLFLLTDNARNNILIYTRDGALLGSWTLNLAGAHGLTLAREGGREVLWITDTKGRVVKASLEGELLLELPHASACGAYAAGAKYAPTEVAAGPDGQIYVADGYGSQFILRFDAAGKYLGKFGGESSLTPGKFVQAHGIAVDTRTPEPLLVCTERMRNEFQWFTLAGEFVRSVYLPGAFVSRPVIAGDLLISGVCFGMEPGDFRMKLNRGFVTILDRNNRVISNPGGNAPVYGAEGKLGLMLQAEPVFKHCHDVCIDDRGDLYVCQWRADRVYPTKLHREA